MSTTITQPRSISFIANDYLRKCIYIWHASHYLLLLICTGIVLTQGQESPTQHPTILFLATLLALWHVLTIRLSQQFWNRRWLFSIFYFGLGWGIWIELLSIDIIYIFMLFSLYPHLSIALPMRESVMVTIVITLMLLVLEGASPDYFPFSAASTLFGAMMSLVMKVFIDDLIRQNIERRQLIEKLEATRGELAAAERQAGILEERQRLAREIHDTLAQGFTSIVIHLEAADAQLPAQLITVRHYLDQARRTARDSLGEARRLVWALQPEQLEHNSLSEALCRLTDRWADETRIATCTKVTGQPRSLRPEVEVTLLRAVQEGLTNICKHACATHVTLTLSYMDDLITLDIQDNGIGFDPDHIPLRGDDRSSGGFGLKAMRIRVEQLKGILLIESMPSEGTTLAISLPVLIPQPILAPTVETAK